MIGLPSSNSAPPEGTSLVLSGFGEENPSTEELNVRSLLARDAGGIPSSVWRRSRRVVRVHEYCRRYGVHRRRRWASSPRQLNGSLTLVGVVDTDSKSLAENAAVQGAINGFVNLAAPEVRDFVEGSETPPIAPRGGGAGSIEGFLQVGHSLSCKPGSWSNSPTFTYAFVNGANNQVLQQSSSPTYPLTAADVGRTILCEVQASNAGGTGVERTPSTPPIQPAPSPPTPPTQLPSPAQPAPTPPPASSLETEPNSEPAEEESRVGPAPSASQITALLGKALTAAATEKITTLRKTGGFAVTFKALEAGTGRHRLVSGSARCETRQRQTQTATRSIWTKDLLGGRHSEDQRQTHRRRKKSPEEEQKLEADREGCFHPDRQGACNHHQSICPQRLSGADRLDALQDRAGAGAAGGAHRDQAELGVRALELVHERRDQPRSGGAERMTERERAAVDVDPVHVGL